MHDDGHSQPLYHFLPKESVKTEAARTETSAPFETNFHSRKYKTLLNSRSECKRQDTLQRIIFPVASTHYLKADKDVKNLP